MSELALGWATYNGDHMSMYGVNASVPKTLVRYLVQYAADETEDKELKDVLYDVLDTPVSPELLPPKEGDIAQRAVYKRQGGVYMEKKKIDWENLGFGYMPTEKRYVANFKDGKWDDGALIEDANIVMNECAGVLQYAQTVFEGLKAYTTEDGHIVTFRPDLNAKRLIDSAKRLEMPPFPAERFVDAVEQVVRANAAYVPPYGSGATLYIRPYMFGINPVKMCIRDSL